MSTFHPTFATLLLALGAPGAVRAQPGGAAEVLLESLEEKHFALHDLTERLGDLPPSEVPGLFRIFELKTVPVVGAEPVELDAWRLEAARGAFAKLSPTAVRAHVGSIVGTPATPRRREAAVLVLGEMGTRQDVGTLMRVAAPADPKQPVEHEVRQAVTGALTRVLARDAGALWALRDAYDRCHEGLLASIPRAVRAAHPPEGLELLSELLGRAPAADALVLAEIGHFGESVRVVVDPMVLQRVRAYLGGTDPRLVQGAALAVRKLDDTRAVPDLLRLLRHPDANVRRSADLALQRIAGRGFRGDAGRWEQWYAEEVRWYERDAAEALSRLQLGDRAIVARTLNELATRRIHREEIAEPLLRVLAHRDAGLVVIGCAVAGKLGLRVAVPDLTALTGHPHPAVAASARSALRQILVPDGGASSPIVRK